MITVLEVIKKTADFLASKGVDSPRFNAETIVGHALNLSRMKLYLQFERFLTETELDVIRPMVRRRAQREPLQYILGNIEFSGLMLKVDKRALIPRPETEYLIEKIKDKLSSKPPSKILDLGTGSGALAIALANFYPFATVTAVDQSHDALSLALENAHLLSLSDRITFISSNWFSALPANTKYDLIISNPPYLSSLEVDAAKPEVQKYEPHNALIAKEGGFADIKLILSQASHWLNSQGLLALEIGEEHYKLISEIIDKLDYLECSSLNDLTGKSRFAFLTAK